MLSDQAPAALEQAPLSSVAELRAEIYGLLGELFLPPTRDRAGRVAPAAARLRRQIRRGPGFPFEPALDSLLEALTEVVDDGVDSLKSEYARLFSPLGSDDVCLPYESRFVGNGGMQGSIAAEVEQAYAEGGLTISTSMGGELPDHVALELQFLAALCDEEAASWAGAHQAESIAWLRRERVFLDTHLGRFLPALARCVSGKAPEGSVYRRLAEASYAFVVHDADLVDTLLSVYAEAGS